MTSKKFYHEVSSRNFEKIKDSKKWTTDIFETVKDLLVSGERVKVTDFGTFYIKELAPCRKIHPVTGEEVLVPAKKVVRFSPSRLLADEVRAANLGFQPEGGGEHGDTQ